MSLFKDIENDLKNKYPHIYTDNYKSFKRLIHKIYNANFWQVFFLYLIFIILSILYTKFLNFQLLKVLDIDFVDNVKTFTTGIITLVSINLFVTNLLFTHLKDDRDDIQTIIDEQINFKFITYLGFTIVLCILLLYFVAPSIKNYDIKSNILIFIFCSFLFYIFQLVFLYNKVFTFIHKNKRKEIIEEALISEFSRAFQHHYLKNEFKKRYINIMTFNLGFKTYSRFLIDFKDEVNHMSIQKKRTVYLRDIDVNGLKSSLINNTSKERFFTVLELDQKFSSKKPHPLIFLTNLPPKKMTNFFSFSKKQRLLENYNQIQLDKLLQKVENNTLKNNYIELNENLNDLKKVYEMYLDL